MPLTVAEVLALSVEEMEKVDTLRVEMAGEFNQRGLGFPFILNAEMKLPDRAHGTFQSLGTYQEFLRLGEDAYIAEGGSGFEEDFFDESGGIFLGFLNPLLEPGADEPFTDLSRLENEDLTDPEFYHITFRMDVRDVLERLFQEEITSIEISAQGDLDIHQVTLLPRRFMVNCEGCFTPIGEDVDLVLDFTLSGFNEPVDIPSPEDEPSLLPPPEPDDHGNTASSATLLVLDERVEGSTEPRGDVDYFSFQAEAEQAYSITVELVTLQDSELTLYDTDGTAELDYNDDYADTTASQIVWAAPTTDTYYVAVAGFADDEMGSYSLNLATWVGEVPQPSPRATPAQAAELDTVQFAMDTMMVDRAVTGVDANTTSTNSWSDNPTGTGTASLYPTYLRNGTTTYFYCWDTFGFVTEQLDSSATCVMAFRPAPAPPAAPTPTPPVAASASPVLELPGSVMGLKSSTDPYLTNVLIILGISGGVVDLAGSSVVITYIDADQAVNLPASAWTTTWLTTNGDLFEPGERVEFNINLEGELSPVLGASKQFSLVVQLPGAAALIIQRTTPAELTSIVVLE